VVLLAVLQRDALHADPVAVLKVNRLQIGEQSEMVIPPSRSPIQFELISNRTGLTSSPWEQAALCDSAGTRAEHTVSLAMPSLPTPGVRWRHRLPSSPRTMTAPTTAAPCRR
jgi:hypothetical protein